MSHWSYLVTLLSSSKFGGLRALTAQIWWPSGTPARLFNELYVGFTFQIMGDDAVKVRDKFDGLAAFFSGLKP